DEPGRETRPREESGGRVDEREHPGSRRPFPEDEKSRKHDQDIPRAALQRARETRDEESEKNVEGVSPGSLPELDREHGEADESRRGEWKPGPPEDRVDERRPRPGRAMTPCRPLDFHRQQRIPELHPAVRKKRRSPGKRGRRGEEEGHPAPVENDRSRLEQES